MSDPPPEYVPPPPAEAAPVLHTCWRCRKPYGDEPACPHCGALSASSRPYQPPGPTPEGVVLAGIMYVYGALLVASLLFAGVIKLAFGDKEVDSAWLLYATIVFQLVDAIIILFAAVKFRAPSETVGPSPASRAAAWTLALPGLAVLVAANLGYHAVLRRFIGTTFHVEVEPLSPLLWVNVLVLCAMPAIIEEIFFRKLALGAMRAVMGTFSAVLISSLMFGLAHIYVALSVPYLVVAGMAFGWARTASGTLALPIALHFLHNLAIVLLEHYGS
jgi:membrane protease YdiL (CAAX protease family)